MKKYRMLFAIAAACVMSVSAFAGEEKCTADTQTCLNMMAANMKERGWMGVEWDVDEDHNTVTIQSVVEDSPAQAAGFKAGDLIVAVDGVEYNAENKEAIYKSFGAKKPGNYINFKVERDGAIRKLNVTLGTVPDEVLARMIGGHMLDHAVVDVATN